MLFGDFTKGSKLTNAGVGENNIDSPFHLTDCLVKTIQIGQFGAVSLNARHVAADCSHGLIELLPAAARDEYIRPLLDEELCCSQPYPLSPAGDDCNFSLQLAHSHFSF